MMLPASLLLMLSVSAQSQEETTDAALRSLAVQVAQSMEKARLGNEAPKALVWVCAEQTGPVTEFAPSFARRFGPLLLDTMKKNRKQADSSVAHLSIGAFPHSVDLQSEPIALQFAASRGYNLLVFGVCEPGEQEIAVHLKVFEVATERELRSVKGTLSRTDELSTELKQIIEFPSDRFSDDPAEKTFRAGKDGVSQPECRSCPNPYFDERARTVEGVVAVRLIVTADGRAVRINFMRRLNPYLDDAAVKAIRNWRFKPAQRDGKPVATWTLVEVHFRQRR